MLRNFNRFYQVYGFCILWLHYDSSIRDTFLNLHCWKQISQTFVLILRSITSNLHALTENFGVHFLFWRYGLITLLFSDLKNVELKIDFYEPTIDSVMVLCAVELSYNFPNNIREEPQVLLVHKQHNWINCTVKKINFDFNLFQIRKDNSIRCFTQDLLKYHKITPYSHFRQKILGVPGNLSKISLKWVLIALILICSFVIWNHRKTESNTRLAILTLDYVVIDMYGVELIIASYKLNLLFQQNFQTKLITLLSKAFNQSLSFFELVWIIIFKTYFNFLFNGCSNLATWNFLIWSHCQSRWFWNFF